MGKLAQDLLNTDWSCFTMKQLQLRRKLLQALRLSMPPKRQGRIPRRRLRQLQVLPCQKRAHPNVRRNPLLSVPDRRGFSPYVWILWFSLPEASWLSSVPMVHPQCERGKACQQFLPKPICTCTFRGGCKMLKSHCAATKVSCLECMPADLTCAAFNRPFVHGIGTAPPVWQRGPGTMLRQPDRVSNHFLNNIIFA